MSQIFQDDFNYETANGVDAFSEYPLGSNSYQLKGVCQESSAESFSNSAVASEAFVSSPTTSTYSLQASIDSIPQSAVGVNAFGNTPLDPCQDFVDYGDDDSFIVDCPETEFVSGDLSLDLDYVVDNPLDEVLLSDLATPSEEACQCADQYFVEEEFEIEIEEPEIDCIEDSLESKQSGFKRALGQVVEGGVATAATSILSAYVSPVVATAVVNTGMAAGKKVCFGIANRRTQKKEAGGHSSPTTIADSHNSASDSKKSSEVKAELKKKGKEIGIEVGKELTKQVCFGIEKRRKQNAKGSAGVGKVSKNSSTFSDSSLDYEPGGGEFGVKDLLSEIDVAEVVRVASSCLCKKVSCSLICS